MLTQISFFFFFLFLFNCKTNPHVTMYDICLNLWDPAKLSQPTTEKNEEEEEEEEEEKKHSTQTDRARKKDCGSNLWRLKSVSLLQLRPWSLPSQVAGARQLARSMSNGDLLQLWYESPSDKWKPFFTVTTFWKLLSSKLAFLMILMLGREDKASKGRVWRGCVWEEKMKKVKEWCWMKWVWFGMKESRWGVKADHWSDYTLTVGPITWVKLQFCHFHDSKEPKTCFHFQSLITHFGENWAKETNLEKPSKQALPP